MSETTLKTITIILFILVIVVVLVGYGISSGRIDLFSQDTNTSDQASDNARTGLLYTYESATLGIALQHSALFFIDDATPDKVILFARTNPANAAAVSERLEIVANVTSSYTVRNSDSYSVALNDQIQLGEHTVTRILYEPRDAQSDLAYQQRMYVEIGENTFGITATSDTREGLSTLEAMVASLRLR